MQSSRLSRRLVLGTLLLSILAVPIAAWGFVVWVRDPQYRAFEARVELAAVALAEASRPLLEDGRVADLSGMAQSLGREFDVRLTLIDPRGTVLVDTHRDPATMLEHASRPEVRGALERGRATDLRHSETLGIGQSYHAVRVDGPDGPLAVARASASTSQVEDVLTPWQLAGTFVAVLWIALGLWLGRVSARRITAPLGRIADAAEQVALGAPANTLPEVRPDEIGEVAHAITQMAQNLEQRLDELEAERTKLGAVLAGMIEGVLAIDRNEQVLHLNDTGRRMLESHELQGRPRSLTEVTRQPVIRETLRRAMESGVSARAEVDPKMTGSGRTLELSASALRDSAGEVAGAVLVMHDVSELRHLETVRSDFVANVSHEIKTPLAAIHGVLETMDEDPDMPAPVRSSFVQRARQQTRRLGALVADLLTLSRLEGSTELDVESAVDLGDVAREAVEGMRAQAQGQEKAIHTQLPDGPAAVLGDPESLRQIVDNLLSNALRYTSAGGRIEVRVRAADRRVVLEVEDNGIGIDPADQSRIFERFYRTDKARSRERGGTGLGLSIVKHATERHRGTLDLKSWPGKGSCFRVDLPEAPRPPAKERALP